MSGKLSSADSLVKVFSAYGFKHIGGDASTAYLSATTINNIPVILKATAISSNVNVEVCTPVPPLEPLLKESVQFILSSNA
jgi:hypothetical protein